MANPILITGATGTIGGFLVEALKQRKVPVRALVRTSEQASALASSGVEAVAGDLTDRATLGPALAGVERAFLLTPGMPVHPQAVAMAQNFAAAAKEAGVCQIVLQSIWGSADDAGAPPLIQDHAAIRDAMAGTAIPFTALRTNYGMQSLAAQGMLATAGGDGAIFHAIGEADVSYVDLRDVAEVAAVCLTEDSHGGKAYKLSGPENLKSSDLARVLAGVLGRPVQAIEPTNEQFRAKLAGFGLPPDIIEHSAKLNDFNKTGALAGVSTAVQDVLGRPPTSFRSFVEASLQAQ